MKYTAEIHKDSANEIIVMAKGDSVVNICDDGIEKKKYIQSKTNIVTCGREDKDDPYFVCDLGDIVRKFWKFHACLPQVHPFYAVKCNPDPMVLKLLAYLGVNFDCASKTEIKKILDLGVHPDRIIFANPCKQRSSIKFAAANNVKLMTFDNKAELYKIKQHFPKAELVIRIRVDDSKSLCQFGIKFGVNPDDAGSLLVIAKELNLNVVGVSFHVGSGCYDSSLYYTAVESSSKVFQVAEELGFNFKLLDIGGGFPGVDGEKITFEMAASELTLAFKKFFPSDKNVRIIAEPGRYFVASAFTLSCNITSVREVIDDKNTPPGYMYYLNDGVYGSFNCILFDHYHPQAYPMYESDEESYKCSIWGPTCDSMDCITRETSLPKMRIGDWVCFDNMGAYTNAAASKFNGFKSPVIVYMCTQSIWQNVAPIDCLYKSANDDLLKASQHTSYSPVAVTVA